MAVWTVVLDPNASASTMPPPELSTGATEPAETSDADISMEDSGPDFRARIISEIYKFRNHKKAAPKPLLTVDGIGQIDLPLTEAHACLIVEKAQQVRSGQDQDQDQEMVVDGDHFEIDGSNLNDEVLQRVTSGLGTQAGDTTIELDKLLLLKEGSSGHQIEGLVKPLGLFAAVIVFLPSEYTGGELVLTHETRSKALGKFSKESLKSVVVVAHFADARCEVKPLLSGYQLALSFNLIRSVDSPLGIPKSPDTALGVESARAVLSKWKNGRSEIKGAGDMIAYVFGHRYGKLEFWKGDKCLKDQDAHLVAHIRNVAENFGFLLCIANLHLDQIGTTNPEDEMVTQNNLSTLAMFDMDGTYIQGRMSIDFDALVPMDFFKNRTPDRQEYGERYKGDEGLEQHDPKYAPKFRADQAIRHLGISFSTSASSRPTPGEQELAHTASKYLQDLRPKRKRALTLLHCACLWKDIDLFDTTMKVLELRPTSDMSLLYEVWDAFGWDIVSARVEEKLPEMTELSMFETFLEKFVKHASDQETVLVSRWRERVVKLHISQFRRPRESEVPLLLREIEQHGIGWFMEEYLIKDYGGSVYDFWKKLVMGLLAKNLGNTTSSTSSAESHSATSAGAKTPFVQCLEVLVDLWDPTRAERVHYPSLFKYQEDRVFEIVELATQAKHLEVCTSLFTDILERQAPTAKTLTDFYQKLLPRLAQIKGLNMFSKPIDQFTNTVVSEYLTQVLGPKPAELKRVHSSFGCHHTDCQKVLEFLNATRKRSLKGRSLKLSRKPAIVQHLCKHLDELEPSDMVSYVVGSERAKRGNQMINITKNSILFTALDWRSKEEVTKMFLRQIAGGSDIVKTFLGTKCLGAVLKFLDGSGPTSMLEQSVAGPSNVANNSQPSIGGGLPTNPVAGSKRKTMD
ncbi:hypothetical protein D9758_004801 [Tetrapyrgos nigripes]|uniref:Uncharacterized protein n=1 Tax=Tetrapyrgos nigripes TaxID=182062 RepID=A0A8H5G5Y2_9AGAR|nr:hypothetical protein D9758_004801 [Tetrapyrgos nigripes]